MNSNKTGFTLIEIMIVLSIISILSAIALPTFQNYTAKADLTNCYKEISPGKVKFEIKVNDGVTLAAATDLSELGIFNANACSSHAMTSTTIIGIVKGSKPVSGSVITLTRDAVSNVWVCDISNRPAEWDDSFLPPACSAS